jgi:hypothetical protein
MPTRRSSQRIFLVLIGTAALPACSPSAPPAVHDRYASLEDCTADWGRPEACEREPTAAAPTAGGGGQWSGRSYVFRGPDYRAGDRAPAQYEARDEARRFGSLQAFDEGPSSHAIEHAVPSPSRGGFGSMARAFGRLG